MKTTTVTTRILRITRFLAACGVLAALLPAVAQAQVATTTVVTSSANPQTVGNAVTFTATVNTNSPTGKAMTATGTVTFTVDGTPLAPVSIASAVATYATSALTVSGGTPHTVVAAYNGDANFAASTSTTFNEIITTTYTKANTTTMNQTTDWTGGVVPTITDSATLVGNLTLANSLAPVTLGADFNCFVLNLNPNGTTVQSLAIGSGNTISLNYGTAPNGAYYSLNEGYMDCSINCDIKLTATSATPNAGITGIQNAGDLFIGGSIGENSAGLAIRKILAGSLILSGNNTYSGGTTISGGILTFSGSGNMGSTTANLSMNGQGVTLDLAGTTQTAGTVTFNQCVARNGTLVANTAFATGAGFVSANLQGASATLAAGQGTGLFLSGTNTYGGTTTISGLLMAAKRDSLPNFGASGTFTVNNAAGILALRAGGSGEWASADIDSLLANVTFTVTTSGGALGIDTTGGNFSYGSAIPNKGTGSNKSGLLKRGPNTLTLSGASTYQGATTIARGTLTLDASAGGSLYGPSPYSALTFSGTGTFNYNTTATSQNLGALTFSAGEDTVQVTRTTDQVLTFGSLATRAAGATANFSLSGGTPSALNGFVLTGVAQGFINQGLFFNGADYAYMDAAGTFVRAPAYGTDPGFTTADTITASTHVKLTTTPAAQNSITLNTLNLAGSGAGFTLNSGQTLTLANGGLLKSGGGTVGTISGGTGISSSVAELVIRTDTASDALAISTPILLNTVTKSGAGALTLSGANTMTTLRLNAGTLNFALPAALPATCTLVINDGATLDNKSGGNLTVGGASLALQINGSLTYLGSDGDLTLGTGGSFSVMPNDTTFTINANTLTIVKEMNTYSTAAVTKEGAGTLRWGGNGGNQYWGGLTINNGVVSGNAYDQDYQLAGMGPLTLGATSGANPAILHLNTGNTHDCPVTARAGSSGILAIAADLSKSPSFTGPVELDNALTVSKIINSGTLSFFGVISGAGDLNIGNTGTFTVQSTSKSLANVGTVMLFRANTYSGKTLVNSGTLRLGANASMNNSTQIALAAGATLDVSQIAAYTLSGSTTLVASGTGTGSSTYARIIGQTGGGVSLGAQPISLTWGGASSGTDTTHPSLYVSQGSLTLNNNTISVVNHSGAALQAGTYRLIQVGNGSSGTLTGNPSTANITVTGDGGGLAANSIATAANDGFGNVVMTVVTRLVTSFTGLPLSQTIQQGTANVTLSGTVSAAGPTYPADGENVWVTINGVSVTNTTTSGNFSIVFPTATIPASGTPYPITYSYGGNAALTPATDASTALTVSSKVVPIIDSWPSATGITYGDALSASSLSGGSASYASTNVPGMFTFTASGTVPSAAGTYLASGTFTPNDPVHYSTVVTPGAISVSVGQRTTTISSPAVVTKHYDTTPNATITGTLANIIAGDAGQVTLVGTGSFDNGGAVGSGITVTPACGLTGAKSPNYSLVQPVGLTGTITQAVLTVTANNVGRPYGVANPPLTYTITGYQGTDDGSTVGTNGDPVLTTGATVGSPVGVYTITNSPGTLTITSSQYSLAFANGQLFVLDTETWAKGGSGGAWDIQTSTNWTTPTLGSSVYYDGAAVLFNDTPSGFGPFTVTNNTTVSPYSVTVSNATKDYVLTGSGIISGTASLTKDGAGGLTMTTTNTYSGGTTVLKGTFTTARPRYGFGSGPVTLADGTTFQQTTFEGNGGDAANGNLMNPFILSGGTVTLNVPFTGYKDLWFGNTVSGSGGFLIQGGTRSVTLAVSNSFSGGVTIATGNNVVNVQNVDGLGNNGPLTLGTGSKANLNYSGDHKIPALTLGGVVQANGQYGSVASGATYQNDTYFGGTGTVTVGPVTPPLTPPVLDPSTGYTTAGGIPSFTFSTIAGYKYRVVYSQDVSAPLSSWLPVVNTPTTDAQGYVLAGSTTMTLVDPTGTSAAAQRFYAIEGSTP